MGQKYPVWQQALRRWAAASPRRNRHGRVVGTTQLPPTHYPPPRNRRRARLTCWIDRPTNVTMKTRREKWSNRNHRSTRKRRREPNLSFIKSTLLQMVKRVRGLLQTAADVFWWIFLEHTKLERTIIAIPPSYKNMNNVNTTCTWHVYTCHLLHVDHVSPTTELYLYCADGSNPTHSNHFRKKLHAAN